MNDLYEFTVEWPSTTAQSVIVTGDFDKWSKSLRLTRSDKDTFTAIIKVPYGCPTRYKFIVDGEWAVKPDQPTEYSPEGYLNNIYYVPLKAPPVVKAFPNVKTDNMNETLGQSLGITDLKDTIVASAGTSSALTYVTSGIGETVRSVVGVDPFNSNQIAIPTPITPSTSIGFPSAAVNVPDDATAPNTESATSTPAPAVTSSGSAVIAPLIPIEIVPVYAKENCTIDPTKVVGDEEGIGTFVTVRPNNVQEVVKKEAERDIEASIEDSKEDPASNSIPVDVSGPPAPAKEVAKLEAANSENAIVKATVPDEEASPPELAPAAASELVVNDKATVLEEPFEKADETLNATSITPVEPATNGHVQDPSVSVKVALSSRPTTPTGTSAPVESVTSTPASTVRKSRVFRSLSKVSTKGGSTDEFDVQNGKDTIGKKKRKSSFFRSLKKLFHHEHHEKDKEEENR